MFNPVRAGIVAEAGQWKWSLYLAFTVCAAAPPWLETDWVLAHFGAESSGQTAYQHNAAVIQFIDLMRASVVLPSVWQGLQGQIYLGSDDFVQRMRALVNPLLAEVPRLQRRPPVQPLMYFVSAYADPKADTAAAYRSGD